MNLIVIGSLRVGLEFQNIALSDETWFAIKWTFLYPPFANSRVAFIREAYGLSQYSARWMKLYPKHDETHFVYLSSVYAELRHIQIKASGVADYRAVLYEVTK